MSKLSINLLTFNGEKYLDPCLESVRCQIFRDFQLLIIDNGSKDKTREKIEVWRNIFGKEGAVFKTIYNETNVGFAEGHNMGIAESQKSKVKSQKYVCCLNQDIILAPDYLTYVVEFMDAHPECGSASGKLMRITDEMFYANKRKSESESTLILDYDKLKRECNIIDSAGLKIFKSQRVIEIGQGEEDNGQYDNVKEVFGVSGTVPVYRMSALEDVKTSQKSKVKSQKFGEVENFEYFDKEFGSYKEDIDLAYRLRWSGWKSYVISTAVAYHKRGAKQLSKSASDFTAAFNRKKKSKYTNYCSQRNQIWTLVKNMDRLNFAIIWYEGKKFIYELIFEWDTFKAWIDALKKIGVMREKRKWIMENRKIFGEEMGKWYE
ncbi:MAG: glycosyltransferase family 2 protein [bacterium]